MRGWGQTLNEPLRRSFSISFSCAMEHVGNEHFSSGNLALTLTHALLTFSENTLYWRILSDVSKNCQPLVKVWAGAHITFSLGLVTADLVFSRGPILALSSCFFCTVGQPGGNKSNLPVRTVTPPLNWTLNANRTTLLHFAVTKCWDGSSGLPFMWACGSNQRKCSGSQYKDWRDSTWKAERKETLDP